MSDRSVIQWATHPSTAPIQHMRVNHRGFDILVS
jgi:hypothetical protein